MPGRSGMSTFCRGMIPEGGGSRERGQRGNVRTGFVVGGPHTSRAGFQAMSG